MRLLRRVLPEWMFDWGTWQILIIDGICFGGLAWVALAILSEILK